MTTPQEYAEKMAAARQRLRAALDPQTDADEVLVAWLCDWDRQVIEGIAGMVERRADQREPAARDDATTACVASGQFGPSCPDAGNQSDGPRHSPAVTPDRRRDLRPGA